MLEVIAVLCRYAEEFGNHDCRQRKREVADKVGFVDVSEVIEQLVNDHLDTWPEVGDTRRRECSTERLAQPSVLGFVVEHHPAA